jgi:hypothetical protein
VAQVKRGPPTMVKNEKGQWEKVKDKATLKRMKDEWEAENKMRMDAGHGAREVREKRERL